LLLRPVVVGVILHQARGGGLRKRPQTDDCRGIGVSDTPSCLVGETWTACVRVHVFFMFGGCALDCKGFLNFGGEQMSLDVKSGLTPLTCRCRDSRYAEITHTKTNHRHFETNAERKKRKRAENRRKDRIQRLRERKAMQNQY